MTTTTIGSLLTSPAADNSVATPAIDPAGHTWSFTGPMDGGPGSATLTALGQSRYQVHLNIESNAGYGDVIGLANRNGNVFNMTSGHEQSSLVDMTCQIQMTLEANQLQVWERDCNTFHGSSLDFSGTLALQPARSPQ